MFLEDYTTCTMSIDNGTTSYSDSLLASDFTGVSIFTYKMSLPNLVITEDPVQIMDILECIREKLTQVAQEYTGLESISLTYSSDDFPDYWYNMTTTEKETYIEKYIVNGYRSLSLVAYLDTSSGNDVTITLSGNLFNKYLSPGTSSHTVTISSGNIYSSAISLSPNFKGSDYYKVYLSNIGTTRESESGGSVGRSSLLSLIPCLGLPGTWEYFHNVSIYERLLMEDNILGSLTLKLTDEDDNDIADITDYDIVLGIDYVDRHEPIVTPSMKRAREFMM